MIKAGALLVSLAITLLISIVSLSLILFSYYNRLEFDSLLLKKQLINNASSGLNLLMDEQFLKSGESKTIDLFNEGLDSIFLSKKQWGIFELAIVKSFRGNAYEQKIAMTGYKPSANDSSALYLADRDKPLTVAGNTSIIGNCYLPKAGVKKGFIEGQSYSKPYLVNGKIEISQKETPIIPASITENIKRIFTDDFHNDSVIVIDDDEIPDTLKNSFLNKKIILYSKNSINMSHGYFQGNIQIFSNSTITISNACHLENVLLSAKKIIIEKNFNGQVQAFASDSITLKENVNLSYPSVLCLFPVDTKLSASITLSEKATVNGIIFSYMEASSLLTKIDLQKESFVKGQVFTNGIVDLKGTIHGNVTCNDFILTTPSSVYSNHILNATIDRTKLSSSFTGIIGPDSKRAKRVISWLN